MLKAQLQPTNVLLWFSILAGPVAWSLHLSVEYFLTTTECQLSAGNLSPLPIAASVALFAFATAGLVAGYACLQATSHAPQPHSPETKRRRFMATAGVILSALFLTGIVLATIPILFLEPCLAGA